MRDQNLRSWWCYFCLTLRIIGPSKLAILCYFEDTTPAVQVQTLPLEGPRSLGDEDFSEDTPNVTLLVGWFSLSPVVKSCYAIHVWKSALAVTFSVAMLKRKSHTIHGTGIFTYIWLILIVHVVVTSLYIHHTWMGWKYLFQSISFSMNLLYFQIIKGIIIRSIWVFPKIRVPQNGWWKMENPIKTWMIWGPYHYFWKPPYVQFSRASSDDHFFWASQVMITLPRQLFFGFPRVDCPSTPWTTPECFVHRKNGLTNSDLKKWPVNVSCYRMYKFV